MHTYVMQTTSSILHLVNHSVRCRAEQAQLILSLGIHCEIYDSLEELAFILPTRGVILLQDHPDGPSLGSAISILVRLGVALPVMATGINPCPARVVQAVKAGVLDYLALPLDGERLRKAIADIEDLPSAFDQARQKMISARLRMSALSPREREVLDWLAEGGSNKIIAHKLAISPRTVEIHRARMMTKIGARHTAEAVRIRIESGFNSPEVASASV